LAGVVGYSGALIGAETLLKDRKSAPPVLLVHGKMDDVVPFAAMAHAIKALQNVNINVAFTECPALGHSIDQVGLFDGATFLRKVLLRPAAAA
jgi:phospholipase/carboxylesterase